MDYQVSYRECTLFPVSKTALMCVLLPVHLQWEADFSKMEKFQRSEVEAEGEDPTEQHYLERVAHAV